MQFYSTIIECILCTSITVWFSSVTKSDLRGQRRVVRTAERMNHWYNPPHSPRTYSSRVSKRAGKIRVLLPDPNPRVPKSSSGFSFGPVQTSRQNHSGPLTSSSVSLFELLPSGRCYRALSSRKTRHRNSFFPQAIHLMNT